MRKFRVWLTLNREVTSCIVSGPKLTKKVARAEVLAQAPSAKIGLIEKML